MFRQLTVPILRSLKPCYDPTRYLPEDWSGTLLDILEHPKIPLDDKLWVAYCPGIYKDPVWACEVYTAASKGGMFASNEEVLLYMIAAIRRRMTQPRKAT